MFYDQELIKFPRHFLEDDVLETEKLNMSLSDLLNPFTPITFFTNIKEAAVFTFVEYLVQ